MRLGLAAMRALLDGLGSPERAYPTVLVAGTNGKGSTAAMLAAVLQAAGYRVGLYTSPHLEDAEERIRISGVALIPEALDGYLHRVLAEGERQGIEPTYFESFTLAANLAFAERRVEIAVVEVGLGGRLDATNACEPILSLITSIDLDHEDALGSTIAAIAREKAGILRSGRPALAAAGSAEAAAVLLSVAAETGAPLSLIEGEVPALTLALPGSHQRRNAALANAAARCLAAHGFERINGAAIAAGLAACAWPGRLEEVPLPSGTRVLLDGAHNPAGAASLAAELEARSWQAPTLLFGAFADKNAERMLTHLAPLAGRIVLTRAPGVRGRDPEELRALLHGFARIFVADDPGRALDLALTLGEAVVVAGSLALVGDVRRELRRRYGLPPPASAPLFPTLRRAP